MSPGKTEEIIEVALAAQRVRRLAGRVVEFGQQRGAPARFVDGLADMAVEIAVRAFLQAEWPMDIDAEIARVGMRQGVEISRISLIASDNVEIAAAPLPTKKKKR